MSLVGLCEHLYLYIQHMYVFVSLHQNALKRRLSHLSDVDECEQGLDDCDENSNCVDTFGSFECICHVGYIKNETQCLSELI